MAEQLTVAPTEINDWAEMMATARMTLEAETEDDQRPFPAPVLTRMLDFQREWHRRPQLRALIRAASQLGEKRCGRSPMARALWLMSQSDAWRLGGARFPHVADFSLLEGK